MKKKNKIIIVITIVIIVIVLLLYSEFNLNNTIKENHKLLFEVSSNNDAKCGYVTLKIYDDGTYEYYDKFLESKPTSLGKYHYNANKVLEKLDSYERSDKDTSKYIIETNNKEYHVNKDYKELQKLLHSIFLYPIRANLNKCPK